MPRPGPRLPLVGFRTPLVDRLDEWGQAHGLLKGNGEPNRSEVINQLLRWALDNYPEES